MSRSGILAAGNFIVDHVKLIDSWPVQDSLVSIQSEQSSNGGGPFNVLINIGKLFPNVEDRPFSLEAAGLVGDDPDGHWIREECRLHGVAIDQLRITPEAPTSYTDVMTVAADGRRTFFHQRGANARFSDQDVDFSTSNARLFYLGYLLLLDRLDEVISDGSTEAASLLRRAGNAGMKRVVDLVSEDGDRFREVIEPSLPETDILLANDFEASRLSGIALEGERFSKKAAESAARKLLEKGVTEWVVIHGVEGAVAVAATGDVASTGSLEIPNDQIVGAVGAGDAFATGILYGLHEDLPMGETLKLAVAIAATCLRHSTTSGGIETIAHCLELSQTGSYRDF